MCRDDSGRSSSHSGACLSAVCRGQDEAGLESPPSQRAGVMGLGRDFAALPAPGSQGVPRDQGLNDSSQSGLAQRKGCVSEMNSRLFERAIHPMRRAGPQSPPGPPGSPGSLSWLAAILENGPFGLHGCGVGTQCRRCGPFLVFLACLTCLGRSARPRSSRRRLWCARRRPAESLDNQPATPQSLQHFVFLSAIHLIHCRRASSAAAARQPLW